MQWGSANDRPEAIAPLLSESGFEAIIVAPAYRLNMFGFMASRELQAEASQAGETAGNLGFWDQRTALEWTAKNVGHFGGDANNITVGGEKAVVEPFQDHADLMTAQATQPVLTAHSIS